MTTPSRPGIRAGSAYWPALDGIRGLFMVLIFAFHAYPPLVPGARISVDAFFVMSAFLITTLLVREHERTGRLDLRRFYWRRGLRLLPAMIVVVPLSALLAWVFIRSERGEVLPTVKSVFFYYANFRADGRQHDMSVFLPTWSLSTEEQFYFVWPTLLVLLYALKARPRVLVWLVGGLVVFSTMWLQLAFDTGTARSAIVFRPDLRVSGILIGTFVGLLHAYNLVPEKARGPVRVMTIIGTVYVLLYLAMPQLLPPRTVLTLAIVVACLAFAALVLQEVRWPSAPYTAVLACRPLVWIGQASYVLYLLHVPVLRLLNEFLDRPSPWVRVPLGAVITLLIGAAVHRWVEKPALKLKERRTPALAGAV